MPIKIAMFKNDKKENENQPDWKGWNKETGDSVAGWEKKASNGSVYISLSFETKAEKDEKMQGIKNQVNADQLQHEQQRQAGRQQAPDMDSFDDDIPF